MAQYTITRLGQQGDGIAEGPIYAPLTLPGEIVTGDLQGDRLENVRIETPSPDRVSAPCRHFRTCGGCQLQHASDAFVANWKREIVRSALSAHGIEASVQDIETSPAKSRRRATFAARRTKKGAMAGFHAKGSDVIVEIPDCQLLAPDVLSAIPAAKDLAITGASRKNGIDVAVTATLNGLDVCVSGGKPLDGPLRVELAHIAEKHDIARLTWDDETIVTRHPPELAFENARIQPPPGAFLQATEQGQSDLLRRVTRIIGDARRVVDLFAGCGTFALPLGKGAEVHAVEGAADMIAALDAGWRRTPGLKSVTHEVRDLFRRPLMPDELAGFDAAVIDPPRAGALAQVSEICAAQLPRIAYVSCNPTTFARDAKTLVSSGYTLGEIGVVDQFRWSTHVELVAEFTFTNG